MPAKTSRSPVSRGPRRTMPLAAGGRADQIVAAAFEEFSAHGFAATRLDDVARRARIAKGTIYLHFKNKELLFEAVVRSLIRPISEDFSGVVGTFEGSAEDLLGGFLARLYAQIVRNERACRILRLLIAESGNFPRIAEIYRREVIGPGLGMVQLVLDKGIASGEFERSKVKDFPQVVVAPAVAAVVWTLMLGKRQPLNLERYFAAHLEFVLRALRPARNSTQAAVVTRSKKS